MRLRFLASLLVTALVASCGTPDSSRAPGPPLAVTPRGERDEAPVVRYPLPEVAVPPVAIAPLPPPTTLPPIAVPADAIYVCVVDRDGVRRQTVIEFTPKVHQLCRRHPEMGPCQYERNACRNAGGRVFAAAGQEITLATEAEYDRKVMRVRFRAN